MRSPRGIVTLIQLRGVLAGMLVLGISGCNGSYEGLVPVVGAVTFDGSGPPATGVVSFIPLEPAAGRPARTATGKFGTDGVYEATSFKPGDGLYPGRYAVEVVCNKRDLDYSKKDPFRDASYVADGHKPQELVVEPDSDEITLDLDVPLKKG